MFKYKVDILAELKNKGWNQTRLAKERPISQEAIQKLRKGEMVGIKTLEKICDLLGMEPGDIIKK